MFAEFTKFANSSLKVPYIVHCRKSKGLPKTGKLKTHNNSPPNLNIVPSTVEDSFAIIQTTGNGRE